METINIFCFMGKTKSGKATYVNKVMSDRHFTRKYNLTRLVCGTTRRTKAKKIDNTEYEFVTNEEFETYHPSTLIESRSYYTMSDGVVYYFTKLDAFTKATKNIICTVTPYQYENYKFFCDQENIKCPGRYKLHLIYIDTLPETRMERMMKSTTSEQTLCEFAGRFIQDFNEFNDVSKRLPELVDPMMSNNVCFISNDVADWRETKHNLEKIKLYISGSIDNR